MEAWDRAYSRQGRLWGGLPAIPELPADARILELGAGSGRITGVLVRDHDRITAVDYSAAACRIIRKCLPDPMAAEIFCADARSLPFTPGAFDIVLAFHVLGHQTAGNRVLLAEEAERILSPGGLIVFRDFSVRDVRAGTGNRIEPGTCLRGNGILTHYFTEEEVCALFPACEVREIGVEEHGMRIRGRTYLRAEIAALLVRH